jgi:O-antigen ligase
MPENNNSPINVVMFILYVALLASLIFSFRAITSISLAALALMGPVKNKIEQKKLFNPNLINPLFLFCCLMFTLGIVAMLYTSNTIEGWKDVRGKSLLVVVPFVLCCTDYVTTITRQKILQWYCLILCAACIFAIYVAIKTYSAQHDPSVFFYHSLVSIYSGHAIQFSILVFIALVYLFESLQRKNILLGRGFHFVLIIFFSLFLVFLSSKLVIVIYIAYFLYHVVKILQVKPNNRALIMLLSASFIFFCVLLFATNNKVSRRFNEIMKTDFNFLDAQKFSPGQYFNGLQFRLLQWKFAPEILNEKKAWIQGVSPGDAQAYLDQKYATENMYTGTPERGDKGFRGYNTHNEFLEALLQTGIIGLLLFLLICLAMVQMAWKRKMVELSFVTILLLAYSFSESVLESQYSCFMFLFFPLFFYLEKNNVPA